MSAVHIPDALLHHTYVLLTLALLLRLGAPQIAVNECGVSRGCFRNPVDCDSVTSCDVIVTWRETQDGESLLFELAGMSTGYVAVGFSGNRLMSNTDVLACVDNKGVTVKHVYNPVSHVNEPRTQRGVTDATASSANGIIHCRFTRVKNIDGQQEFADLREEMYVILARGMQSAGYLTYHTLGYSISNSKQDFSIYQAPDVMPTSYPPDQGSGIRITNQPTITDSTGRNTESPNSLESPISSMAMRKHISMSTIAMVTSLSLSSVLWTI